MRGGGVDDARVSTELEQEKNSVSHIKKLCPWEGFFTLPLLCIMGWAIDEFRPGHVGAGHAGSAGCFSTTSDAYGETHQLKYSVTVCCTELPNTQSLTTWLGSHPLEQSRQSMGYAACRAHVALVASPSGTGTLCTRICDPKPNFLGKF